MMVKSVAKAALMLGAVGWLGACGGQKEPAVPAVDSRGTQVDEIIGGFDAKGASLNAIGTVGTLDGKGQFQFFCSATLIGPQTVLTAKHCAVVLDGSWAGMKLVNLLPIYFAVGPDSLHPIEMVEAIAADVSPKSEGGFVGLGSDVSVYHLKTAITSVKPMPVSATSLTDADVGHKYVSIGFGAQDVLEDTTGYLKATRKMGYATLNALRGKSFELMLGSFDAFIASMVSIYGKEIIDANMDLMHTWYDETVLFEGYEAWLGHAAGDAQTCHGDSGGPLLHKATAADGSVRNEIFGVVSGGWFSSQLTCDYGTFYATVGAPDVQSFIQTGLNYQDPCANLPDEGTCAGTVATRCTHKYEGDRRAVTVDCADLDQVCGVSNGTVACLDPNEPPTDLDGGSAPDGGVGDGSTDGGNVDGGTSMRAPTIAEIRQLVENGARGGWMRKPVGVK